VAKCRMTGAVEEIDLKGVHVLNVRHLETPEGLNFSSFFNSEVLSGAAFRYHTQ